MVGNRAGALAHVDDDVLIERIAAGSYVSHLAREHGVTDVALHLRLKVHPRYKEAMRCRNAGKLDQHQDGIEKADDPLSLACAREGFKAAAWRAERECPEEWGQRTHVTGDIKVIVAHVTRTDLAAMIDQAERVIEGKALQISDDSEAGSDVTSEE